VTAAEDGQVAFRLVKSDPPTAYDFTSPRERKGNAWKFEQSECRVRAVSLWDSDEKIRTVLKVPLKKNAKVARVVLTPDCGALAHDTTGHISWWACKNFDPIKATVEVLP
jgi:hypothetical protein